jgi:hypothetical protein
MEPKKTFKERLTEHQQRVSKLMDMAADKFIDVDSAQFKAAKKQTNLEYKDLMKEAKERRLNRTVPQLHK